MATDEPLTKLAEKGSHYLMCPLCGKIYRDPVINVSCGHTFCRVCTDTLSVCPIDGADCVKEQLVVNKLVVGLIDDLKIHCRHGVLRKDGQLTLDRNGCPEIIRYGQRTVHEDTCHYALLPCPFATECGHFRRSQLEEHQSLCKFKTNTQTYNGGDISSQNCSCETSQSEMLQLKKTVEKLTGSNVALQIQLDSVLQKIASLEQFNRDALTQVEKCTRTVASLQDQFERLASQVHQMTAAGQSVQKFDHSFPSSPEDTQGTALQSSAGYIVPNSPTGVEKWEMPFQFKCLGTLRGHQDIVWCLTAYQGRLYSAGNDKVIKVWNIDQLAKGCVNSFQGHTERIHAMVRCGSKLFTGGADSSIRCWDIETGTQISIVQEAHDNVICAMVIAGDYLFTSSFSQIKVWDLHSLSLVKSFSALHHWVRALAVSPGKDKLYSGSHNAIDIWETSGRFYCLDKINHECGSVHSLAATKMFIIAGNSGTYNQNLQVFSATTYQFVTKLSSHLGTVTALAVSQSERYLFSASQDTNIFVWNLENFLPIQSLSRHQGGVNALAVCGNMVLSGSEDHEIKVFRYFSLQ